METRVMIVNNKEQALRQVQALHQVDYPLHRIYILSADQEDCRELTAISGTGEILTGTEGLSYELNKLLRSSGDRLMAEMEALGLTEQEARQYEQALEFGGYLIVAKPKQELPSYLMDHEWTAFEERIPSLEQSC